MIQPSAQTWYEQERMRFANQPFKSLTERREFEYPLDDGGLCAMSIEKHEDSNILCLHIMI